MKQFPSLVAAVFAFLCIAEASETILEEDFAQGEAGAVFSRVPATGNPWQGLAGIEDVGLVHGGDTGCRSASTPLDIPADAKILKVTMEGIYSPNGQFAFGFTNNPQDILGEGQNNRGLIWVGFAGPWITLFGGEYANENGDKIKAHVPDAARPGPFKVVLTVELVPEETPVPVTFSFNDHEALAGSLLATKTPNFSNFFIQFRENEQGEPNRSEIGRVTITAE